MAALGRLWALQGRTVEAREAIAQLPERSKATYLEVDPALDPLRGDPRFADIAAGMKKGPQGA